MGPSPLTRGSRSAARRHLPHSGSIPAHAGQPCRSGIRGKPARVHPRSRGAAPPLPYTKQPALGPSPLTRGSPAAPPTPQPEAGSIPAHAGQPARPSRLWTAPGVHPRSRGAAVMVRTTPSRREGPSPLTRGSPFQALAGAARRGSIPAHAGQPHLSQRREPQRGVHPRSRGAAPAWMKGISAWPGPSPLTRGSPVLQDRHGLGLGSIPAHAGQPLHRCRPPARGRVHPRSRGAACIRSRLLGRTGGPSPLTRGSLDNPTHCHATNS